MGVTGWWVAQVEMAVTPPTVHPGGTVGREALVETVGMADQAGKRPDQLSGGQKQRVAIARALVTSPKVVLADEPTANLDSRTAHTVIDLMKKMRDERQTTFIFSTHDQKLVSEVEILFRLEDGLLENHGKEE